MEDEKELGIGPATEASVRDYLTHPEGAAPVDATRLMTAQAAILKKGIDLRSNVYYVAEQMIAADKKR